jgi:2-dehydro-3-deoxygalactonokinase
VPGIKNKSGLDNDEDIETMDIMRDEETEATGILKIKSLNGPLTLILPGTHTKVLKLNEKNQITTCLTTMAGEIFSILVTNTILADSVPKSLVTQIEPEEILKGALISHRMGFTRGCFSTRIISQFTSLDGNKKVIFYLVLLGIILGQDLIAIKDSNACNLEKNNPIVIGGPNHLRKAFYYLFEKECDIKEKIIILDDDTVEMSTVIRAKEIGLNFLNKGRGSL